MSTSILYHMFSIRSVQYVRSNFFAEKQIFTARFIIIKLFVLYAAAGMLFDTARRSEHSKCRLSEKEKQSLQCRFQGFYAKTALL